MFRFFLLLLLLLPAVTLAQNYVPLVGIPGVENSSDFGSYINALYGLSISIAALLAVIKIIIAGVKWMMTDVAPSKSDAKDDIKGALLGLLVVLAAVLILTVINRDLTNADLDFERPEFVPTNQGPTAVELAITKCADYISAGSICNVQQCDTPETISCEEYSNNCQMINSIGAQRIGPAISICVQPSLPTDLSNSVGVTIEPGNIVSTEQVSRDSVGTIFGINGSEVGDSELGVLIEYLEGEITIEQLAEITDMTINQSAIENLSTSLSCDVDNEVGYQTNANNITFSCISL